MNGLTNATSQDATWCPKHQTAKWCWFDGHSLTRLGSRKTWVFIPLHRLEIRHSKILLILARPLPIGYFTFYYFSCFLIFNRMGAWSLIRLGVLLLIPKSLHTLDWLTPSFLKKNLPQNVHGETNTQSNAFW